MVTKLWLASTTKSVNCKLALNRPTSTDSRLMHNSVHMASHIELYLAKYTLTKRQIKMQRDFYTAKSPN